jgi:hypothetical protein
LAEAVDRTVSTFGSWSALVACDHHDCIYAERLRGA